MIFRTVPPFLYFKFIIYICSKYLIFTVFYIWSARKTPESTPLLNLEICYLQSGDILQSILSTCKLNWILEPQLIDKMMLLELTYIAFKTDASYKQSVDKTLSYFPYISIWTYILVWVIQISTKNIIYQLLVVLWLKLTNKYVKLIGSCEFSPLIMVLVLTFSFAWWIKYQNFKKPRKPSDISDLRYM